MDTHTLQDTVIIAAVAAVVKEGFTWLIQSNKTAARTLIKTTGKWILKMAWPIEFAVDAGLTMFLICSFFMVDGTVTVRLVQTLILAAFFSILQFSCAVCSWRRWMKPTR